MIPKTEQSFLKSISNQSFFSPETVKKFFKEMDGLYFDDISIDARENIHFLKNGSGETIQIIFHITPPGVMIGEKRDESLAITMLGEEKPETLKDLLLYHSGEPVGFLRQEENAPVFLEAFPEISLESGVVGEFKNDVYCEGDLLYGMDLSSVILPYISCFLLKNECLGDKRICFTIWNSSVSGECGAIEAMKTVCPDVAVLVSCVPMQDGCAFGEGPALVLKDGTFVLSAEMRKVAKEIEAEIKLQSFLGKTNKVIEKLNIANGGRKFLGIYLPVKHKKTRIEEMHWEDVEKTRNFLLKFVAKI